MAPMLVLSRKPGERIHIGSGVTITVVQVQGNRVRLGIDAPKDVSIARGEVAHLWGKAVAEALPSRSVS
jgi:carbon storage regulator